MWPSSCGALWASCAYGCKPLCGGGVLALASANHKHSISDTATQREIVGSHALKQNQLLIYISQDAH